MDTNKLKEIADIYKKKFAHGSASEENTKQSLIEPVLSLLGWDISDTDEVRREWKNSVDYALFIDRQIVYIEAKKAGNELNSASDQVKRYAAAHGESVEFVVVTNGRHWRCYSVRTDLQVFTQDITIEPHKERNLSLLSRESIKNGDLKNAANFIRAEHEVMEDLRFKKDAFIEDLCKRDSSLSLQDVKKVYEQLLNRRGELTIPKTRFFNGLDQKKSLETTTQKGKQVFGDRILDQLPIKNLKSIADFIVRLEKETGKIVEVIHIGKKGEAWHPDAIVRPNFYVICNDGSKINNTGKSGGYNPANCVEYTRDFFFSTIEKVESGQ